MSPPLFAPTKDWDTELIGDSPMSVANEEPAEVEEDHENQESNENESRDDLDDNDDNGDQMDVEPNELHEIQMMINEQNSYTSSIASDEIPESVPRQNAIDDFIDDNGLDDSQVQQEGNRSKFSDRGISGLAQQKNIYHKIFDWFERSDKEKREKSREIFKKRKQEQRSTENKCKICEFTGKTSGGLKTHIRKKHNVQP